MTLEILSDDAIERIVERIDFNGAVRAALIAAINPETLNAPVLRIGVGAWGGAINAKFACAGPLVGGKLGTYWIGNTARGLPNHGAATILFDPDTGFPRALVAARLLNRLRTAAGDAVAVEVLARRDASTLALIGAGAQAPFEARAIARVRPITEIRVAARDTDKARKTADELKSLAKTVRPCPIEEAVIGADIVVTATSAREALIRADWIRPGAHISAMGADAAGKQEIDPYLLRAARFFADLPEQSAAIGEGQHAEAPAKALGDVLNGRLPGRASDDDITIFDSSGLAVQDLFVADAALAAARAAGLIERVMF